jgi:hypothetical protein
MIIRQIAKSHVARCANNTEWDLGQDTSNNNEKNIELNSF